ncbi:MAG: hypothetical protein LBH38_03880 [Holosporales bacterium]|jgi:hypothetical protein|nr:hypothetical protein [Holosporales bacterium]
MIKIKLFSIAVLYVFICESSNAMGPSQQPDFNSAQKQDEFISGVPIKYYPEPVSRQEERQLNEKLEALRQKHGNRQLLAMFAPVAKRVSEKYSYLGKMWIQSFESRTRICRFKKNGHPCSYSRELLLNTFGANQMGQECMSPVQARIIANYQPTEFPKVVQDLREQNPTEYNELMLDLARFFEYTGTLHPREIGRRMYYEAVREFVAQQQ